MKKRNLNIDFDRVIHRQNNGYKDGCLYDKPTKFCKEAMILLSKKYNLYVFTARDEMDFPKMEEWLSKYKIPYKEITNIKHSGWIIDDHAFHFTGNWRDVLNQFVEW